MKAKGDEITEKKIFELSTVEILSKFSSSKKGLSSADAKIRLDRDGLNLLGGNEKKSRISMFVNNFKSPLIYILLAASIVTFFMREYTDSVVIFIITVINACIGYYQQQKTENALEALRKMTALFTVVIRDGKSRRIRSEELVVGDIVVLEEGDKVPADGRLIEASSLLINEAVLTGESLPVTKDSEIFLITEEGEEPQNLVFMGTTVLGGRGLVVVTATGKETEFGKISKLVEDELGSLTPLQAKLADFSKKLGAFIILICFLILVLGLVRGIDLMTMIELSISMAVSAIPEGLPVAITVILVLGVKRMAKQKAILRNLTAVETLGTTTVIASDKTGTITHNKLTVTKIFTNKLYRVSGEGFGLKGEILENDLKVEPDKRIIQLLRVGVIANNGKLQESGNRTEVFGDPTDCAILVAARKVGIELDTAAKYVTRIAEIPFSSENKYHAVLAESSGAKVVYMKGALEEVLRLSKYVYSPESSLKKMTTTAKSLLEEQARYFASRGLRVIALGYREENIRKNSLSDNDIQKGNFVFVGLIGMRDTYRSGVKEAISKCHRAGIRMIMITGDHLDTARAIGQDIGIVDSADEVIEAQELEKMPLSAVRKIVKRANVFARISPISKFRIIEALKANGEIVAMTGDGVNDVPALKKADIGVAMGVMGTEAAKDASDMVLTDDNFSTLVLAVSEGRAVFSNIRKTLFYLLSTNLGEVLTVSAGLLFGYPLVLLPLQILWINLVTDSCTAIPLGMEPAHTNQINRPPRDPKEHIVSKRMIIKIILIALTMSIGAILIFRATLPQGLTYARTMVFTFLVVIQWLNVINARSESSSIFSVNPFSNKSLIIGVGVAILLQLLVLYTGFFGDIFEVASLGLRDWLIITGAASTTVIISEIEKLIYRLRSRRQ
jgi:Ca2+-transporting ATPase